MAASKSMPNICTQEFLPGTEDLPVSNLTPGLGGLFPDELAVKKDSRWAIGKRLRVRFLNGDEFLQQKVKYFAEKWEEVANISFDWVTSGNADIRVSFNWKGLSGNDPEDKGSWSYVGKDAAIYVPNQALPTMNFGWFDQNTNDNEFSRTATHEFGHAIGCIHEHQNPDVTIQWNRDVVIRDMSGPPNNWSVPKIEHNILNRVAAETVWNSKFDENSIMLYAFPAAWTTDGRGTHNNYALSEGDKAFIRKMYPPRTHNTGTWNTSMIRNWYPPVALNTTAITFDPEYNEPPKIVLGLNQLDMSQLFNYRIQASAKDITTKDFRLNLDSWADSQLYSAGATWLEMLPSEIDFECGDFDTTEVRPNVSEDGKLYRDGITFFRQDIKHVDFSQGRFASTPRVIVWLKAFDTHAGRNCRIRVRATAITKTGFDLVIESWADTKLYRAAACWFAYRSDLETVVSGEVSTRDYRDWYPAQLNNGGKVKFDKHMSKLPKVYLALSYLDFDSQTNLRTKVYADKVADDGFEWHGDSWADTLCYGVGANWIAFG